MPSPRIIQRKIEQCYQQKGFNGFKYAYQYPGFTHMQQAAGRAIRSETDRGIVILVDHRFTRDDYQTMMPRHWKQRSCNSLRNLHSILTNFWS